MSDRDRTGWYEFLMPGVATTHIAYVYEDGSVYLPEGPQVVSQSDFLGASAEGRAHRLVWADDLPEVEALIREAGEQRDAARTEVMRELLDARRRAERAEKAEAAVARVRAVLDDLDRPLLLNVGAAFARRIRYALDGGDDQ